MEPVLLDAFLLFVRNLSSVNEKKKLSRKQPCSFHRAMNVANLLI